MTENITSTEATATEAVEVVAEVKAPKAPKAPKVVVADPALVQALRTYAGVDTSEGWSVIHTEWTDEQIADAIKGAKTLFGARLKVSKAVYAIRAANLAAAAAVVAVEAAEDVAEETTEVAKPKRVRKPRTAKVA